MSDLTYRRIKPKTSRAINDDFNHLANQSALGTFNKCNTQIQKIALNRVKTKTKN